MVIIFRLIIFAAFILLLVFAFTLGITKLVNNVTNKDVQRYEKSLKANKELFEDEIDKLAKKIKNR